MKVMRAAGFWGNSRQQITKVNFRVRRDIMKFWRIWLFYCRRNFSSEVLNRNQTRQHRIRRHIDAKVRFEWTKIRFVQRNFVFLTESFALSKPFSVCAKRDVASLRSLRSAPRIESSGRRIAQKKFRATGENRTHHSLSSSHWATGGSMASRVEI